MVDVKVWVSPLSVVTTVETLEGASMTGRADTFFRKTSPGDAPGAGVKSGVYELFPLSLCIGRICPRVGTGVTEVLKT